MWINGTWVKQPQDKKCKVCTKPVITTDARKQYCSSYCKQKFNRRGIKQRQYSLKHMFNLTLDQYNEMLRKVKNQCEICETKFDNLKFRPCVDHDHQTNKIRGILCNNCNAGLGFFAESHDILQRANAYANRSFRRTASGAIEG